MATEWVALNPLGRLDSIFRSQCPRQERHDPFSSPSHKEVVYLAHVLTIKKYLLSQMKFVSNEAVKISDEELGGCIQKLKNNDCAEAADAAEELYRLTSLPTAVSIDVRVPIEMLQDTSCDCHWLPCG
jgi:hypothetical protein